MPEFFLLKYDLMVLVYHLTEQCKLAYNRWKSLSPHSIVLENVFVKCQKMSVVFKQNISMLTIFTTY